ncbi:MAG: LamG domain-containing protein [Planctomycetota bacterium]
MSVEFIRAGNDHLRTQAATFGLDGGFTIACWIRTGATLDPYGAICAKPLNSQFVLGIKADRTLFLIVENDSGSSYPTADAVPAGVWTHVAATYNDAADELTLFINGVSDFDSPRTCTTVMTEEPSPLHIGQHIGGQKYEGLILDLAIWSRALSAGEIHSLATARLVAGFISDGLTGWWPLHVPGDGTFDEAVTGGDMGLQDFSRYQNPADATISGAPAWRRESPGLHWPSRPYLMPFVPAGGGQSTRRVSIGSTFIDSTTVVLVG